MSTEVSANALKSFLVNNLGIRKLDLNQAQKYDVDADKFLEADLDENGLDVNEILKDEDLYEQFATLFIEAKEQGKDVPDEEKEKEEALKVKDKGESKA